MSLFLDLQDDVAGVDTRDCGLAAINMARRVLALFRPCPDCNETDESYCHSCGGMGVVASDKWPIPFGVGVAAMRSYLFG